MFILIRWLTTPLLLMTPIDITVGIIELIFIRCILELFSMRKEMRKHGRNKNRRNTK